MTIRWFRLLCHCSNFWSLRSQPWSPNLLIPLICSPVISACFWEWNRIYDGVVFRTSLKFMKNLWLPYTRFQNVSSSTASSSGRSAGPRCINSERTTLNGITTTNNRRKGIFRYWLSTGTFGHAVACYTVTTVIAFTKLQTIEDVKSLDEKCTVHDGRQ